MEAQREVEGVGRGPSEKPPKRSEWTEDVGEEMKGRCIGRWEAEIQTIATSSLRELLISTKTFFFLNFMNMRSVSWCCGGTESPGVEGLNEGEFRRGCGLRSGTK